MENRLGLGRRTPDSGSYSDLNRLNQLKVGKDRDGAENVRKVAQEFESLFMNEMLKSMRSATEVMAKDNPFNSQASKQYQDMHDQQLSVTLSKEGGGIGLADVLIRQLNLETYQLVLRRLHRLKVPNGRATLTPTRRSLRLTRPVTIPSCSTSVVWPCRAVWPSGRRRMSLPRVPRPSKQTKRA